MIARISRFVGSYHRRGDVRSFLPREAAFNKLTEHEVLARDSSGRLRIPRYKCVDMMCAAEARKE
jgi:hypothetical protein